MSGANLGEIGRRLTAAAIEFEQKIAEREHGEPESLTEFGDDASEFVVVEAAVPGIRGQLRQSVSQAGKRIVDGFRLIFEIHVPTVMGCAA
jgi:hypothetical protein